MLFFFFLDSKIEWSSLWQEEESTELEGTLNVEVLHGKVVLPIVSETLVEASVLVLGDILWLAHPDWLDLVKDLILVGDLLDLLLLLVLLLIDLLDLWLVVLLVVVLLLIIIRVSDLLLSGLLDLEGNWEG